MLRLITAATKEPVSVEQAKRLLHIDHAALDEEIPGVISAAREIVERRTGYALAEASYEWTPVGGRVDPLPIWPGLITSDAGVYPILFSAKPGPAPWALKLAIVMLVGDLLENPEGGGEKVLHQNPAFAKLVFPFTRVLP